MVYLILSILSSVIVGVLFKFSRRYELNNLHIITCNYAVALGLCYFLFSPDLSIINVSVPWFIYAALGLLLPTVFLVLARSINGMGIVKTDAAQRLSLFIPILASWLIFGEKFNTLKISALVIGFLALVFILIKPAANTKNEWHYPAMVLFGFGIIDVLFKQIALFTTLSFTTSLFVIFAIALLLMILIVGYQFIFKKESLKFKNILYGCLVGSFNFANIFFYLKAHQVYSQNPSTVFAGMNMGVIIIGSLVGIGVFKEKITKTNYTGLFLALIAIILIVLSQE